GRAAGGVAHSAGVAKTPAHARPHTRVSPDLSLCTRYEGGTGIKTWIRIRIWACTVPNPTSDPRCRHGGRPARSGIMRCRSRAAGGELTCGAMRWIRIRIWARTVPNPTSDPRCTHEGRGRVQRWGTDLRGDEVDPDSDLGSYGAKSDF